MNALQLTYNGIKSITDYFPFGMEMAYRSWSAGGYRFGYNGMEKDNDINGEGNSYSTEYRLYDSRIGRWTSMDPLKRPFESNYSSFSNSPIVKVDPNGDSDFYTQNGEYIGSDGTSGTDIFVITSSTIIEKILSQTQESIKSNDYGIYTGSLDDGTFFKLPPYSDRQKIQEKMNSSNTNYKEVGGVGLEYKDGSTYMRTCADGEEWTSPNDNAKIDVGKPNESERNVDYSDMSGIAYDWHAHPDGEFIYDNNEKKWYPVAEYNAKERQFNASGSKRNDNPIEYAKPTASKKDILNKQNKGRAKNGYVLQKTTDNVNYYNANTDPSKGNSGTFPLKKFYTVKAKPVPNK